jgi:hypothetical protein
VVVDRAQAEAGLFTELQARCCKTIDLAGGGSQLAQATTSAWHYRRRDRLTWSTPSPNSGAT